MEVKPNPADRFEDFLLETFYDPLYTSKDFPFSKLIDVLDSFDEVKWKHNEQFLLVYKTYIDRINQWKTKTKSIERKYLISRLSDNPQELRIDLQKFKVLLCYKDLGYKLLGKDFTFFETLRMDLHRLQIDPRAIPDVITQITLLLNNFAPPVTKDEMMLLISSVSGYLVSEFEILEDILLKSPDLLSEELVLVLAEKFESLQYRLGKRIARLNNLIQPEKPQIPDKEWIRIRCSSGQLKNIFLIKPGVMPIICSIHLSMN